MFELIKFLLLRRENEVIFKDIIGEMAFYCVRKGEIIFQDKNGSVLSINIRMFPIVCHYEGENVEKNIFVYIPVSDKVDNHTDIKVLEMIKEKRDNGCVIEYLEKRYDKLGLVDEEKGLLDLVSKRYVLNKDVDLLTCGEDFLKTYSIFQSVFESHIEPKDSTRCYTDCPSFVILLNGADISYLYDEIEGIDKIDRIYDLYKGVINQRNAEDIMSIHAGLLSIDCFGYKDRSGITELENAISGDWKDGKNPYLDISFVMDFVQSKLRYTGVVDCLDLDSLSSAIVYRKHSTERSKEVVEQKLGIPYEEFDKLDLDAQQLLIQNYWDKYYQERRSRRQVSNGLARPRMREKKRQNNK